MSDFILPPPLPADLPPERVVGITTTVPIEVILAAGLLPVDLNNLFIAAPDPQALAEDAEHAGFPRTCCCWTKGIYGAVRRHGVRRLVGVTRGDCSNAEALLEVFRHEGGDPIGFSFPARQNAAAMQAVLEEFAATLGADLSEAERWRERLAPARAAAAEIDRLSHEGGHVHGLENHLWLVSASDFCADPDRYEREARAFIAAARARGPLPQPLRLGLCGIPPIVPALYGYVEQFGAVVVYNETQRQFAMGGPAACVLAEDAPLAAQPAAASEAPANTSKAQWQPAESLAEQYTRYTYPYGVFPRAADIRAECARRRLDGLIHYVQSFCHRRIEDRIVRDHVELPVLTLEADRPGPLSGQMKTRLEAFLQMLAARKAGRSIL